MEQPWSLNVFATDSSDYGYGACVTKATLEEVRQEAQYTELRGWTVQMEDVYTDLEDAEWQPDDDEYLEHIQWMYGGGREAQYEDEYYDEMQEGLERGRQARQSNRAFGQRKWGSSGFVAAGGSRLAARVPGVPSPAAKAAGIGNDRGHAIPEPGRAHHAGKFGRNGG